MADKFSGSRDKENGFGKRGEKKTRIMDTGSVKRGGRMDNGKDRSERHSSGEHSSGGHSSGGHSSGERSSDKWVDRAKDNSKTIEKNKGAARNNTEKTPIKYSDKKPVRVSTRQSGHRTLSNDAQKVQTKTVVSRVPCPVYKKCGGCQLLDMTYERQLEKKQKELAALLKGICPVHPIIGMENPYHYRNKVHAVFDHDRKGNPISGVYKANTHEVVPIDSCLIEDKKADEIICSIRGMLKSFKIRTFDEDTGYGLLRHVLVKRGFTTDEIMVVLVTASPVFPSKNNFVKALREKHPEITTIIQNVNNRNTSMVLGDKENVLFGKGYIEDILCGCKFRISSKSFYQVNPVQTEILYKKAIEAAKLTGKETVIDAYCGIGTIGIIASRKAGKVIGVELNPDAVKDAVVNARCNEVENIEFYCNDAGAFMRNMAEKGESADVVFMDPPRSGSTEEFMDSVVKMGPGRVVYVSCGPETLKRDLEYLGKRGYKAMGARGVDLFPWTNHCEVLVELCRK